MKCTAASAGAPEESPAHRAVVEKCANLNLPLNAGKQVIGAIHGSLLGGELDGVRGVLSVARGKSAKLAAKAVVLAALPRWLAAVVQHWVGLYCFGAMFRRPVFSALEELFTLRCAPCPVVFLTAACECALD